MKPVAWIVSAVSLVFVAACNGTRTPAPSPMVAAFYTIMILTTHQ